MRGLLLGSKNKWPVRAAEALLRESGLTLTTIISDSKDDLVLTDYAKYDVLISVLYHEVLPKKLLDSVAVAINFHPGPPEYPGIGCTNFALYEGTDTFGATAHLMSPQVDSGSIILVKRFPIAEDETVLSLTEKAYECIVVLVKTLAPQLSKGDPLKISDESWTRQPFRRTQLDALCKLTLDMTEEEMNRRIRATTFPGKPGSYICVHGHKFEFVGN